MNSTVTEITPWGLFLMGGPLMWPILLCSVAAVTVAIRKFLHFSSMQEDVFSFQENIFDAVKRTNIKEAVHICDTMRSPCGRVMREGVIKFGTSRNDISDSMEEASQLQIHALEEGMPVLRTIISVTPLLGILGTLVGLCVAFHMVQIRAAALNPVTSADIAYGIWQALITTVAGLMVSIFTHVIYSYFTNCINEHVHLMEKTKVLLTNFMTRTFDAQGNNERDAA